MSISRPTLSSYNSFPFAARRFAAGEHSRNEITAAALQFVEEQLSARPISKAHWDEVTFMLTVFKAQGDGGGALFANVQAIARRLSSACVVEARAMRDAAWAAASEDARARLRGLENFGAVRQPVPEAYLAAVKALVPHSKIQQYALRFDVELMVSAMCCVAETALGHFREKLISLFPKARLIADVNDMRDDETACVVIASVKNAERVREKIKEATSEHSGNPNMWPFIQLIGDLLRASVILGGFGAFADAWSTLSGDFDVRDGHGRLKNNLWTDAERPPDVLLNVVIEPPGDIPPIVGEVQLHLREILVLKESSLHRMYEVVRASSMDALLAEAARAHGPPQNALLRTAESARALGPQRNSLAATAPAPPRTELAARAAPASEVELV